VGEISNPDDADYYNEQNKHFEEENKDMTSNQQLPLYHGPLLRILDRKLERSQNCLGIQILEEHIELGIL
jgi:hypothetical protein